MKKLIYCDRNSYRSVLNRICNQLTREGRVAKVNYSDRCVDVFDGDDVVEQHYPERTKDSVGRRGKFIRVPQGEGNYICEQVDYVKKNYTEDKHRIKHVNDVTMYNN